MSQNFIIKQVVDPDVVVISIEDHLLIVGGIGFICLSNSMVVMLLLVKLHLSCLVNLVPFRFSCVSSIVLVCDGAN